MKKNVPKKVVNGKSRKESSRLSKIYFPGGREIASSRLPGKHRPDSREDFLCSLCCDSYYILRPLHHPLLRQSPWTPFLTTFLIPLVAPSRTRTSVLQSSRTYDRRFAIQSSRLSKVFAGCLAMKLRVLIPFVHLRRVFPFCTLIITRTIRPTRTVPQAGRSRAVTLLLTITTGLANMRHHPSTESFFRMSLFTRLADVWCW